MAPRLLALSRRPVASSSVRYSSTVNVGQVLPSPQRVVADRYLDFNGEEERALAWGHLQSQMAMRMIVEHRQTWVPVGGFGDTGAVRGALSCILAARALQRGYAKTDQALVWIFGDQREVGLVVIGRERKA